MFGSIVCCLCFVFGILLKGLFCFFGCSEFADCFGAFWGSWSLDSVEML